MKKILLITFLIVQSGYSQNVENAKKLYEDGVRAFSTKNYRQAQEKFKNAIALDSLKKDYWFNLALANEVLNEHDAACEAFYSAHRLGDGEAVKYLNEYCPDFRNGSFKNAADVDSLPQYIHKNKKYPMFQNGKLDNHYLNLVKGALHRSTIISKYQHGKLIICFNVDQNGKFQGRVLRDGAAENGALVRQETVKIFMNLVDYIPAKYHGKNVQVWENWTLPLDFEN